MMQSIDSRNIINAVLTTFFAATVAVPFVGLWRSHDVVESARSRQCRRCLRHSRR